VTYVRTFVSMLLFCLIVTLAAPISPLVENLMPSFVTEMETADQYALSAGVTQSTRGTLRFLGCAGIIWAQHTCVADVGQVLADPLELTGRHSDHSRILSVRYAEMLTVNQLQLEI
jgi:hypothetical protein